MVVPRCWCPPTAPSTASALGSHHPPARAQASWRQSPCTTTACYPPPVGPAHPGCVGVSRASSCLLRLSSCDLFPPHPRADTPCSCIT
eukprot:1631239-Pyramimonas_sp.AAC.2